MPLPFPGLLAASQTKWWLWQFLSHPPQPRTLLQDCKIKMLANSPFSLPLSITVEKDLSWLRPSKAAQSASVECSTDLLPIQEKSEITWNHMSWIASNVNWSSKIWKDAFKLGKFKFKWWMLIKALDSKQQARLRSRLGFPNEMQKFLHPCHYLQEECLCFECLSFTQCHRTPKPTVDPASLYLGTWILLQKSKTGYFVKGLSL